MNIDRFLGLDLREGDRAAGSLVAADNLLVDARGSLRRRPGLARVATLPEGTAGLYAVDDTLRACAPNGTSAAGLHPAVFLDYVDATSVGGRVEAVRVPSGRRALWVEQDDGGMPGLHCTDRLPETARTGSRIVLPWSPYQLLMSNSRLVALDRARGMLAWSGVADPDENDGEGYIRTWDDLSLDDAAQNGGNASVSQAGSEPQAIADYGGLVAVLSLRAIQLIEMSTEGAVAVAKTIGGPGTRHPGTCAAMSSDLIYADVGGAVRNIATDTEAAGAQEAAIGARVEALTRGLTGYNDRPRAIYARALGAYLLFSGNTVVPLSILPGSGVLGWSKWTLPVAVDEVAEARGMVFVRAGRAVYGLDPNAPDDEVDTGDRRDIAVAAELVPAALGGGESVSATRASVTLSEAASLAVLMDGRASSLATMQGLEPAPSIRRGCWKALRHALRITSARASAGFRIDAASLE